MTVHGARFAGRMVLGAMLAAAPATSASPFLASPPHTLDDGSTSHLRTTPAVAFGAGVFLAVWTDRDATDVPRIFGARVVPVDGGRTATVTAARIVSSSGGDTMPSVAFSGSEFVVVWRQATSAGVVSLYGQIMHPDGTPGAFFLATVPQGGELRPRVACNGSHGCMVLGIVNTTPSGSTDLLAIPVDAATGVIPVMRSPTVLPGAQAHADIAWDGSQFVAVWTDINADATGMTARLVQAGVIDPTVPATVTRVLPLGGTSRTGLEDFPAIACRPGAGCVAAWELGPSPSLRGRALDLTGAPTGSVSLLPAGAAMLSATHAALAFDGRSYLLGFTDIGGGVATIQGLEVGSTAIGRDLTASSITPATGAAIQPAVASDPAAMRSLVVYTAPRSTAADLEIGDIRGRFVPYAPPCAMDSDCATGVCVSGSCCSTRCLPSGIPCMISACRTGVCDVVRDPRCGADAGSDGAVDDGTTLDVAIVDAADAGPSLDAADTAVTDVTMFDAANDLTSPGSDAALDTRGPPDRLNGPSFRGSGCACTTASKPVRPNHAIAAFALAAVLASRRRRATLQMI